LLSRDNADVGHVLKRRRSHKSDFIVSVSGAERKALKFFSLTYLIVDIIAGQ